MANPIGWTTAGPAPRTGTFRRRKGSRIAWAYVFILPQLLFLILFTLYPIIMSYVYSFYDWNGIGPLDDFVNFDNYSRAIGDERFWNAFKNSFIYTGGVTLLLMPSSLLLAIWLNNSMLKGRVIYRTLYFLPVVTTTAIIGIIMRSIFGNQHAFFNELLISLRMLQEPYSWLGKPTSAMIIVIVIGSWKFFGMMMVYWLAGLQSLPKDIYEAASIDGCDAVKTFRYMTLPLIMPIAAVVLLLCVTNSLHVFDLVKTLTEGGPYYSTDMMDLYIYRQVFDISGFPQYGYASAAGIIFGLSVFGITLVLSWFVKQARTR
ncbi:carbohydrate ABC transporter permease [Paenibacillus chungangensis]|uniref:Carbohydrate ABC transporter permease n=1 Tax=Paenibacillus chungangensis TaxID=696535 RepID=A0ABW3HR17_9BACL